MVDHEQNEQLRRFFTLSEKIPSVTGSSNPEARCQNVRKFVVGYLGIRLTILKRLLMWDMTMMN